MANILGINGLVDNHWRSNIPGIHFNGDRDLAHQYRGYAKQEGDKLIASLKGGGQSSGRVNLPLPANPVDGKLYNGFIKISVFPDGNCGIYVYATRGELKKKLLSSVIHVADIIAGDIAPSISRREPIEVETIDASGSKKTEIRQATTFHGLAPDSISAKYNPRYIEGSHVESVRHGIHRDLKSDVVVPSFNDMLAMTQRTIAAMDNPDGQPPEYWTQTRWVKPSMYTGLMTGCMQVLLGIGNPYKFAKDPREAVSNTESPKDGKDTQRAQFIAAKNKLWEESERVKVTAVEEGIYAVQEYLGRKDDELPDRYKAPEDEYLNIFGRSIGGSSLINNYLLNDGYAKGYDLPKADLNSFIPTNTPRKSGLPYITYDYRFATTNGITLDDEGYPWLVQVDKSGLYICPLPIDPTYNTQTFRTMIWDAVTENRDGLYWQKVLEVLDTFKGMPSGEAFPGTQPHWVNSGFVVKVLNAEEISEYRIASGYFEACGWAFSDDGRTISNTGWRETGTFAFTAYEWSIRLTIRHATISKTKGSPSGLFTSVSMPPFPSSYSASRKRALRLKMQFLSDADWRKFETACSGGDAESAYSVLDGIILGPIVKAEATFSETTARLLPAWHPKFPNYTFNGVTSSIDLPYRPPGAVVKNDNAPKVGFNPYLFYGYDGALRKHGLKDSVYKPAVTTPQTRQTSAGPFEIGEKKIAQDTWVDAKTIDSEWFTNGFKPISYSRSYRKSDNHTFVGERPGNFPEMYAIGTPWTTFRQYLKGSGFTRSIGASASSTGESVLVVSQFTDGVFATVYKGFFLHEEFTIGGEQGLQATVIPMYDRSAIYRGDFHRIGNGLIRAQAYRAMFIGSSYNTRMVGYEFDQVTGELISLIRITEGFNPTRPGGLATTSDQPPGNIVADGTPNGDTVNNDILNAYDPGGSHTHINGTPYGSPPGPTVLMPDVNVLGTYGLTVSFQSRANPPTEEEYEVGSYDEEASITPFTYWLEWPDPSPDPEYLSFPPSLQFLACSSSYWTSCSWWMKGLHNGAINTNYSYKAHNTGGVPAFIGWV